MATSKRYLIWDLPLRLFHWSLAVTTIYAWYSIEIADDLDTHFTAGFVALGLILFRIVWGFIGPKHARFSSFVEGPSKVLNYIKGSMTNYAGHNPLGALSVIFLLATIGLQVITGLFADDEYYYFGPLNQFVSRDTVSMLTKIHHINSKLIILGVVLHIAAIAYYLLFKKHNLVTPMITGYKKAGEFESQAINSSKTTLGIIVALISLAFVLFIRSLGE